MVEEIIGTAHAAHPDVPRVELISLFDIRDRNWDEIFRLHFADGMTVDIPVQVLGAMLIVGRHSCELPASMFGDTTELAQRLDRLIAHIERPMLEHAA